MWPHEEEPWFHSWYRGRVETLDANSTGYTNRDPTEIPIISIKVGSPTSDWKNDKDGKPEGSTSFVSLPPLKPMTIVLLGIEQRVTGTRGAGTRGAGARTRARAGTRGAGARKV